ncbi:glycosyltransferase family 90 protein [Acephala macrosclerotiorum]|nr:glycosyltransferase family 90 protein [Acephala macrosclerotiorum]
MSQNQHASRHSSSSTQSQYHHFRPNSNQFFLRDHDDSKLPSINTILMRAKRRMRSRQFLVLFALLIFASFSIFYLRTPPLPPGTDEFNPPISIPTKPQVSSLGKPAVEEQKPQPPKLGSGHPIWQLVKNAEQDFEKELEGQSKTLEQAVAEYKRRYGIPPPPNFDKWWDFAKERGVQMIDEYDSIYHSLTPFWGLKPSTIRARAREALGFDGNNLIGALIRNGEVKKINGGREWQEKATKGMMAKFIQYLPDMDLCFNIHDEPRVVVPSDDLSRLVSLARDVRMPAANAVEKPRNSWSPKPSDLSDGLRFEDVKTTRFNEFAHQSTWTHSRMSCPPDSPSRNLEDGPKEDNFDNYAVGELGFVYNQTAFSDICQSPSFSESYGFFERPNAYNIVHDLFPIFSQSKISSYNDIVYPSPWYWYGKVPYSDSDDMLWNEKEDKIYWRGSTTGGFSRDGGWRHQHRQHLVQKVNALDNAKILINRGVETSEDWQVKQVPRSDFKEIFDIHFSYVGQCDPGDCHAQKEFFDIKEQAKQKDAWKYKYLLDIDGNAFSGRFYAFLKSRSLVYKLALFREWHEEWLKPWVHFIPLSLRGDEWVEAVRWFAGETSGKKEAERIALQGRDWADKVLRNEDMEVWFFRLLLEYGRLVDDDRETIGYTGA